MTSRFREIPAVNDVLRHQRISDLIEKRSREWVVELVREELAAARKAVAAGDDPPKLESVAQSVVRSAASKWKRWPETVINATGVILHTNLGRAPLSEESVEAAAAPRRDTATWSSTWIPASADRGRRTYPGWSVRPRALRPRSW